VPTCVFCGNEGKLTKEHVFPAWVRAYLQHPDGAGTHQRTELREGEERTEREHRGEPAEGVVIWPPRATITLEPGLDELGDALGAVPTVAAKQRREDPLKTSHGMRTHLRARTPSGRIVEFSDGTVVGTWEDEDESGRRGFFAITADGRGAWKIEDSGRTAAISVCDELGLDKGYIIGGEYAS
jgi:hypothetical protein